MTKTSEAVPYCMRKDSAAVRDQMEIWSACNERFISSGSLFDSASSSVLAFPVHTVQSFNYVQFSEVREAIQTLDPTKPFRTLSY